MSTSFYAVFNGVFDNVYFVIVIFKIHGRKIRFSESSQNFISEKSIFEHLRSFFSTYVFFPRRTWLFPISTLEEEYFNELSSWSQKNLLNFPQKYQFWPNLTT